MHARGLSVNNYVREKSVKLMSVNNKVQKNIGQFQHRFSVVSGLRLVNNSLKMTVYDEIDGNKIKNSILRCLLR